jgi:hypothetical protein
LAQLPVSVTFAVVPLELELQAAARRENPAAAAASPAARCRLPEVVNIIVLLSPRR